MKKLIAAILMTITMAMSANAYSFAYGKDEENYDYKICLCKDTSRKQINQMINMINQACENNTYNSEEFEDATIYSGYDKFGNYFHFLVSNSEHNDFYNMLTK